MSMPIIRLELENVKHGVMHHMQSYNDDFNVMVQETLEQTLTEDWVKQSIQEAVNNTVQAAVNNLGDNWTLRSAVSDALAVSLAQMVHNNISTEQTKD